MVDVEKLSKEVKTPFGEIGYIVFKRTYSRKLKEDDPNSKTEEFWQVIERELESCRKQLKVGFTSEEEEQYAKYRLGLKFSVAGRFMWQMGTKTVDKLGLPSLQNCSFVTINQPIRPFTWAFEMLMLGSGVGFNIQKENVYQLPKLKKKIDIERLDSKDADFIIPDSREGWIKLLGKVLKSHFYSGEGFTYSAICVRGKGTPIKGFGGTASGPEELCWGIDEIHKILNSRANKKLRPIDCLDIMNIIGYIVVSGNVRRSAQIAIGDYDDTEFLKAKRWDLGTIPNWRSMSNNSIYAPKDIDDLPKEFWDTYEQGEPYGLINLELSKSCGRTGETKYPDPEVDGFNPCFTGDMKLLTASGYKSFKELSGEGEFEFINKDGNVVNGTVWSNGEKDTITLNIYGGKQIVCTPNHVFMDNKGNEIEAKDTKGVKLMPYFELNKQISEYTKYGFIQGDAGTGRLKSKFHKGLEIYFGEKDDDVAEIFSLKPGKQYVTGFNDILIDLGFSSEELPNRYLPSKFRTLEDAQKLDFLKGLYSANGCIVTNSRVAFKTTCKELSQQLVDTIFKLSRGQVKCYITTNKTKVIAFSNGNYTCKESYDVNIGKIEDIKWFAKNIGFIQKYKQDSLSNLIINRAPLVISIGKNRTKEVFDFNLQDDIHWGVVEGVIAHNCAEQSLANFETCCLSEVYLPNIDSYEQLLDVLKYTYRVNKHSLNLHCSLHETESIVHKNMRMGIGMTGILQASEEQRSWAKDAYTWLRGYDKWYSGEKGFPESIKLTTIKPSGTLSLLAGVTPGIHPSPAGPYYYRRVRMASDSPLLDICKSHGYSVEPAIEFDGSNSKTTMVVTFPCKIAENVPIEANYTYKEQLDMVRRMQKEWSDNSVSCTVYYKKDNLPEIKQYLKDHFSTELKTVSFLLSQGHGFKQAPYETISKEQYEKEIVNIKPITSVTLNEDSFEVTECGTNGCPIK